MTACPKILDAFSHSSKLLLLRGETGVGKTHAINCALEQSSKMKLVVYDSQDFNQSQFSLNLYSSNLDGLKRVIVLDHFHSFALKDIEYVVQWSKSRVNCKRKKNWRMIQHSSVILVCDNVYVLSISKHLLIHTNDIIDILPPNRDEKIEYLKGFCHASEIAHQCKNYFDLELVANDMKQPTMKNNQRKYKPNFLHHDKSLFRDNIFHAIDAIRHQPKQARGLMENSFDMCSQFEPDKLAAFYYNSLLSVYDGQYLPALEDISDSLDTFGDIDLCYFPSFVKETLYQVAIYQSPTYAARRDNEKIIVCPAQSPKADNTKVDLMRIALGCFGRSNVDFLTQLWTLYDVSNITTLEVFPSGFLQWNEDHRSCHNQKAIEFAVSSSHYSRAEETNNKKKRRYYQ